MKGLLGLFFRIYGMIKVKEKYQMEWFRLKEMLSENPNVKKIVLWDGTYKYTDFGTWLKIIALDMVKWHEYRVNEYDCDNFAMTFAGLVPFLYGINGVGIVIGKIVNPDGSEVGHAWNIFIAMKNNGEPMLYMYEPQSGMFTTYKSGRIMDKLYVPEEVIWG